MSTDNLWKWTKNQQVADYVDIEDDLDDDDDLEDDEVGDLWSSPSSGKLREIKETTGFFEFGNLSRKFAILFGTNVNKEEWDNNAVFIDQTNTTPNYDSRSNSLQKSNSHHTLLKKEISISSDEWKLKYWRDTLQLYEEEVVDENTKLLHGEKDVNIIRNN